MRNKRNLETIDNYHLINDGDKWALVHQGGKQATLKRYTKEEAIKASAEFLGDRGASLKIHKKNGQIQEERTYPRKFDPPQTKG